MKPVSRDLIDQFCARLSGRQPLKGDVINLFVFVELRTEVLVSPNVGARGSVAGDRSAKSQDQVICFKGRCAMHRPSVRQSYLSPAHS